MSRTFIGSGSYLDSSSSIGLTVSVGQTICAWVYQASLGGSAAGCIAGLEGGDGQMTVAGSGGTVLSFGASFVTAKATIAQATSVANTLSYGVWQFLAAVYNSVTGVVHLYLNGVEVSYASQTNHTGTQTETQPWYVGAESSSSNFFVGLIDTVAYWNTALTTPQIATAMGYNGPADPSLTTDLVGYWPLLGTTSPEPDLSGNARSLTVNSAVQGVNSPGQTPSSSAAAPTQVGAFLVGI